MLKFFLKGGARSEAGMTRRVRNKIYFIAMQKILFEKLKEAFASVLPITLIVLVVSHTPLVTFSVKEQIVFTVSAIFLIILVIL